MNTRVAFSIIAAVCFCVLGAVVLGYLSISSVAPAMDGVKAAIDVVDSAVSGLIGALGGYAMARALPRGGSPEA